MVDHCHIICGLKKIAHLFMLPGPWITTLTLWHLTISLEYPCYQDICRTIFICFILSRYTTPVQDLCNGKCNITFQVVLSCTTFLFQVLQIWSICFWEKSTFLHTLFGPKTAFFWPRWVPFDPKPQKHSGTSCFNPKHCIPGLKLVTEQ